MKIFLEILKSKQKGPLCREMVTNGQISRDKGCWRRGARVEEAEGNKLHLFVALGGKGVDRGGLPAVVPSRRWVRVMVAALW
jgi:hypothetical protein